MADRLDSAVPNELRELKGWLLWKTGPRDPVTGKFAKIPHYVSGGKRFGTQGAPEDRAALVTFDVALARFRGGGYDGVGLAMLGWGVVGRDYDNCRAGGVVAQWVLDQCRDTYTEVSPSGTGLRAFNFGEFEDRKNHEAGIETFCRKGFLTVTGERLNGCDLAELPKAIADELRRRLGPDKARSDSAEVLRKACAQDPTLARLKELGLALRDMGGGKFDIRCPWETSHSTPGGAGDTVYFARFTGGFASGNFCCMHSHCAERRQAEFREAIGLGARDADPPLSVYEEEAVRVGVNSSQRREVAVVEDEPDAGADHGDAAVSTASADEVLKTFRKWLYIPDEGSVYVPLGAVAANLMEGDPVWLMTVGPPSGGKTEIIIAIASLPYFRLGATLTEAALLSGTPKKQRAAGSKGGLLREIGDFGILALKDFTSVLSMNRDTRAQLLAALREIFDGSWTRHVGTDGGRTLAWSGKLGLIAGCTAAIDSFHGVMSVMGERFLLYRLPTIDPSQQAKRAITISGMGRAMRKDLAAVVGRLFAGLDIHGKELPPLDEDEVDGLVALSSLVAAARSAVERNPYGAREIDLILDTEAPARLAQTLCRLYAGMRAIGLDRAAAWRLVVKTGLDCIPKLRRAVFDVLLAASDWLTTKAIAAHIQHPTITARRTLEDLSAHGVVDRRPGEKGKGDGKSDLWQVSDTARTRHEVIVTEKSVSESGVSKCTPYTNSINTHPHFDDDISDLIEKTASECGSQGGFDVAKTPGETPDRRCWSCKGAVGGADRCGECGWMICACGACSSECAGALPGTCPRCDGEGCDGGACAFT